MQRYAVAVFAFADSINVLLKSCQFGVLAVNMCLSSDGLYSMPQIRSTILALYKFVCMCVCISREIIICYKSFSFSIVLCFELKTENFHAYCTHLWVLLAIFGICCAFMKLRRWHIQSVEYCIRIPFVSCTPSSWWSLKCDLFFCYVLLTTWCWVASSIEPVTRSISQSDLVSWWDLVLSELRSRSSSFGAWRSYYTVILIICANLLLYCYYRWLIETGRICTVWTIVP